MYVCMCVCQPDMCVYGCMCVHVCVCVCVCLSVRSVTSMTGVLGVYVLWLKKERNKYYNNDILGGHMGASIQCKNIDFIYICLAGSTRLILGLHYF